MTVIIGTNACRLLSRKENQQKIAVQITWRQKVRLTSHESPWNSDTVTRAGLCLDHSLKRYSTALGCEF